MTNVLVIAPHPDDETLGCGGTLLKHKSMGHKCHWLIVTSAYKSQGFSKQWLSKREKEIQKISNIYSFITVAELKYPTAELDTIPKKEIVSQFSKVIKSVQANVVYVPFWGDAHSDHGIVFDAAAACTKSFRFPTVKSFRAYETLSETELSMRSDVVFKPNCYVDIVDFLEEKIELMGCYESEVMTDGGPRSPGAIRALATYRWSAIGSKAAEAFLSLKEVL